MGSVRKTMNKCPICDQLIFRQISQQQISWYCSCCHQEVPNFSPFQITQSFPIEAGRRPMNLSVRNSGKNFEEKAGIVFCEKAQIDK